MSEEKFARIVFDEWGQQSGIKTSKIIAAHEAAVAEAVKKARKEWEFPYCLDCPKCGATTRPSHVRPEAIEKAVAEAVEKQKEVDARITESHSAECHGITHEDCAEAIAAAIRTQRIR